MTTTENYLAENRQLTIALRRMSEFDLTYLLNHIEALQVNLRLLPLANRGTVEVVSATQDLLKLLNDEVVRMLMVKQVKSTLITLLHNWNNEGEEPNQGSRPAYFR